MLIPDRLKSNAYRVLGLSGNATLSEIHSVAGEMRRKVQLGLSQTTDLVYPSFGEVSRSESDIRAAMGRLGNPVQRLTDRLLWFHVLPENHGIQTQTLLSQTAGVEWSHDEALRSIFGAIEAGFDEHGIAIWIGALRAWHKITCRDDYWAYIALVEQRGRFEPQPSPAEINTLRADAVGMAAEPLQMAASDAVTRDDTQTLQRIMSTLNGLSDIGSWVGRVQHEIASPAIARIRSYCKKVNDDYVSKIIRENNAVESNRRICDSALKCYRSEIETTLKNLFQLVPPTHEVLQEARELTALCLGSIATSYTWANEFIKSEKLHEEALKLAQETVGKIRIERGLAEIRSSAHHQRTFGKPVTTAPSLRTVNGFGVTLYGGSDYDQETRSVVMTYYLVIFFIPFIPLARYRVINAGGGRYQFLGKLPLRKFDFWYMGIVLAAIFGLIIYGNLPDTSSPSNNTFSSITYASRATSASGDDSAELNTLKARIDKGRSRISVLETDLKPVNDELNSLQSRIEALGSELKELDTEHSAGIRIDIAGYNEKVGIYNRLLAQYKVLNAANKAEFKEYDDLIKEDGVLVNQYNALVKSQP